MTKTKVILDLGDGRTPTFRKGGKKRFVIGDGFVYVNADFIFADGTEHKGIVEICEDDHGEHYSSLIFTDKDGIVSQDDEDFLSKMGKTKEEVFPYKYNYRGVLKGEDFHVDETGWSY